MQLPIDFKALIDETTNIEEAHQTPIDVSVYIDDTAPADLIGHVRNAFASSMGTVRMTISYLGKNFIPQPTDDLAVLVAGENNDVGEYADSLRAVGVPVMIVAADGAAVAAKAEAAGHPIPNHDLISSSEEGEAMARDLDTKMGRWIVSVCRDKRLAYAIAFPFVRRPLANDAVRTTAIQNAAVGVVPFIPGADMPIMTLNQAKMVLQIGAAYGQHMDKSRWKEVAAVMVAAYLTRGVARRLVAAVPVVGFAIKGGVAYGLTAAMGYGVIEYFEGGQNVTGLANVVEKATEASTGVVSKVRAVADKFTPMIQKRLGR